MVTDNGNFIVDVDYGPIQDPEALNTVRACVWFPHHLFRSQFTRGRTAHHPSELPPTTQPTDNQPALFCPVSAFAGSATHAWCGRHGHLSSNGRESVFWACRWFCCCSREITWKPRTQRQPFLRVSCNCPSSAADGKATANTVVCVRTSCSLYHMRQSVAS